MSSSLHTLQRSSSGILTRDAVLLGLACGLLHALVALWAYASIRPGSFGEVFSPEQAAGALLLAAACLGLVVLGAVPAVLLYRRGLVAPVVTLIVLFSWSFYRSWQSFAAASEVGATPGVTLRPDSVYVMFWVLPLAIVLVAALAEHLVRGSSRRSEDARA